MPCRLAIFLLALILSFPPLAASRTVSDPPPRDPDLTQASALMDKGDCEGARTAFLAAAADLGPMFAATVKATFGEPCTLKDAKALPRALKAVALAEQGRQAQAAVLFLSLAQEGDLAGAEMSMEFPLMGNATNPNPVSSPEMAKAREDYSYWRDDEAMPVIRRYADQGDPMACYLLADFLGSGPGSENNSKQEIADWYERAAERGSARALVYLADFYQEGAGRPRDPEKADALLRQAVGKGMATPCTKCTVG
jgi:TPR repeat protein